MRVAAIEVTIDELVLHGFAASDRYAIAEAVQRELARLVAAQGVSPSLARGGETACLNGGAFPAVPGMGGDKLGSLVAQGVYRGLNS